MWIVYTTIAVVVIVLGCFWASAIIKTHEKYPDYKGRGNGLNFDDDIDWDVTLMDGLKDKEEKL